MTTFASLNLSARILDTLAAEGYQTPTPIQAQAIPPVLEGRDLLGSAQTGTGKTAAFALPMIDLLSAGGHKGRRHAPRLARALILAPTRELAAQIEESLRTYGRRSGLRHTVIYGGVSQYRQVRDLESGVDVIVATPGRLMDLMDQGYVDLNGIEIFVLDEADRMLDMGFIEPIRQIARVLPEDRQTLLFSATMPPKIRQLADTMLRDPVRVSVTPAASAVPLIDQAMYHMPEEHKLSVLTHFLRDPRFLRTLVFTKTKHGAERLAKRLCAEGVMAAAIHGNKSQSQRERALDAFRMGRCRVLVATDVAARGLDVDGITHVVNFNLPMEPEAYIHRIGRTGRAGAKGRAISFCSRDERGLLRGIERLMGKRIEVSEVPEGFEVPPELPAGRVGEPVGPMERPVRTPHRQGAPRPANAGARSSPTKGGGAGPRRGRAKAGAGAAGHGSGGGARGRGAGPRRASGRPR